MKRAKKKIKLKKMRNSRKTTNPKKRKRRTIKEKSSRK
ncbi:unnamed protein product [Anisakis simplex]|uniref:Uncharacterized protein n=1 Tax=Anisakis simplex TaxID=6269 RepID=A0A3P6R3V8_ANISI|nr:unnamed protein product [Anisakis simplex]